MVRLVETVFSEGARNVFLEDKRVGNPFRQEYADGAERLIEARFEALASERASRMPPEALAADPEGYRRQFVELLGWPLTDYAPGQSPAVRRTLVREEAQYALHRLQLEALPGLWFYGLLFVPKPSGKYPLIIAQHGGGGTPELCADLNGNNNYRRMAMRALERGAVVFAPQLFLWDKSDQDQPAHPGYGVAYDRLYMDMRLRQLGGSITALELTCLRRSLDYLLTLPEVDGRAGMLGLSYGGFFSIMLPAVEPRIKSAYSCCYFAGRKVYHTPDWLWQGAASRFLNAEIAALIAPRALCIEVGRNDPVLPPEGAREEYLRALPYFEARGAGERLLFRMTENGHKLDWGDEGYDFLFHHLND